jgi:hypothetical protein
MKKCLIIDDDFIVKPARTAELNEKLMKIVDIGDNK